MALTGSIRRVASGSLRPTIGRNCRSARETSMETIGRSNTGTANGRTEMAKDLVIYEKLGAGPNTDLLSISLSANDVVGHQLGPDSPQMRDMAIELDRQLGEFFTFLGHQVGLANVWMALSADHGIAPLPEFAKTLRLPAANVNDEDLRRQINSLLSKRYAKTADYVLDIDYPLAWLNEEAFAGHKEADAEANTGEAMRQTAFAEYFTKSQLARGETAQTEMSRRYAH